MSQSRGVVITLRSWGNLLTGGGEIGSVRGREARQDRRIGRKNVPVKRAVAERAGCGGLYIGCGKVGRENLTGGG